jgi:hypothetical protein
VTEAAVGEAQDRDVVRMVAVRISFYGRSEEASNFESAERAPVFKF